MKNTLYNIAHSIIMLIVMFDVSALLNVDFPKAELPVYWFFIGFGIGILLGGFWEYVVEQNILRMPANKWDLINMTITGIVGGILSVYYKPDSIYLWILSAVSIIFVVWYFVRMWKSRLTRVKIDY